MQHGCAFAATPTHSWPPWTISIGLRWQAGTAALPPYCLGHIGYGVVPWKQGRAHATQALRAMLEEAKAVALPYVELTTDTDNLASQRVIQKCGGVLHETFAKPAQFANRSALRYRIHLDPAQARG